MTGSYSINAVPLSLQPESGAWLPRDLRGIDGNGRPIYAATRSFELRWSFMSASEFHELQTYYDSIGSTGTVVAELPEYGNSSYQHFPYSGCVLREPSADVFFEQHYSDVILLVTKIRT